MTVIEQVVRKGFCCSCGVCAGVCPANCLRMELLPNGDLAPVYVGECIACGKCLAACPFRSGLYDPRVMQPDGVCPPGAQANKDAGCYLEGYVGFARQERDGSASGGLLTLTLKRLFETGEINHAAVVAPIRRDGGGRLFNFRIVSSPQEVAQCAGSYYYPVEISGVLREIAQRGETASWAVVGVPCLCAGVRRAMALDATIGQRVKFLFGLACGMYQNSMYTECLSHKSGVAWADVAEVRYRVKGVQQSPGNYGFQARSKSGRDGRIISYASLPCYLGRHGYFRQHACNFCKDVFAEMADACFMDAWLPEYADEPKGTSLILVRDVRFHEFLKRNLDGDRVEIHPIGISRVVLSQSGTVMRKRKLIDMRLGRGEVRVNPLLRLSWWLERRTATRSKTAWRMFGRKWGLYAFWAAMADLVLLQRFHDFLLRAMWKAARLLKKIGLKRMVVAGTDARSFILFGIGGLYNYGCEAIVRGTVLILRDAFPNCDIAYLSKRPEEDAAALTDCPVRVVPHADLRFPFARRALKYALRRLGIPNEGVLAESLQPFRNDAVVLSVGGDIFTLGKGPYPNLSRPEWLDTHFALARRKAPYVLWGASIGPFEQWPQIVPFMTAFLRRLCLITVREPVTINYLKQLDIADQVEAVFDPAFLMPGLPANAGLPERLAGESLVGVNFSPLSVNCLYGADGYERTIQEQGAFLTKVMQVTEARLLLIPHVVCPGNAGDDDMWYLRKIQEGMPAEARLRVSLLEPGLGAMRTKGVIAQCDALLAARMHCAIAGVSIGTPTMFLAYSAKAVGMSELIYGHGNYCILLDQLATPAATQKFSEFWSRRVELRTMLAEKRAFFETQAFRGGTVLKQALQRMGYG